jgi:hypothetical protein
VKAPELPAVRYAVASIRHEYQAVRREQPGLTPWEAFALAKQRHAALIVAANTAIELVEVERRMACRAGGPWRARDRTPIAATRSGSF